MLEADFEAIALNSGWSKLIENHEFWRKTQQFLIFKRLGPPLKIGLEVWKFACLIFSTLGTLLSLGAFDPK